MGSKVSVYGPFVCLERKADEGLITEANTPSLIRSHRQANFRYVGESARTVTDLSGPLQKPALVAAGPNLLEAQHILECVNLQQRRL